MRKPLTLLMAVLVASTAAAEEFGSRFRDGYQKLRDGDPEAALASFQNLLTETPDSELVRYSIASAEYALGVKKFGTGDVEAATESLNKARGEFDELRTASTPFVREQAGFASANALAQIGKNLDEQQAYKDRLNALQAAVQSYDAFLAEYPDHEDAQTNLNHTSYLLKKMLQNPPPDQEKSDDDSGEGENENQSQQGDQGQQPEENNPDDQQQPQDDQSESDQSSDTPQDQASEGKKTADENIEAILQSLEDKNQEEQKNLRKAKEPPRVRDGKWW